MNVHGPSPPACRSTARPKIPSSSNPTAHGATGRCEKPKHAPTNATAPTTPAMPTPAVKNSNSISDKPGDEQEVRDPRRVERVRELLGEIELAEAHDLVGSAPAGSRRRRRPSTSTCFTSPVAVWSTWPSSPTMNWKSVGCVAVDHARRPPRSCPTAGGRRPTRSSSRLDGHARSSCATFAVASSHRHRARDRRS